MLLAMLRLHRRGPDNRGLAVDAEGAVLGPECLLVRRGPTGFQPLDPASAAELQKALLRPGCAADWLFEQCRRIAEALAKGEVVALAQI
jgi:hypothetical protein